MAEQPLHVQETEGLALVTFRERFDLDMLIVERISEELHGLVAGAGFRGIVLDLTNVRFLSSPALSMLIGLRRQAQEAGMDVALCGMGSDARRLFQITRLDKLFSVSSTPDEALAGLRSPNGREAP